MNLILSFDAAFGLLTSPTTSYISISIFASACHGFLFGSDLFVLALYVGLCYLLIPPKFGALYLIMEALFHSMIF